VWVFLRDRGLLDDERLALLLSWQEQTGFSPDNSARLDACDTAGLDRLARYLLRSPVSLERWSWNEEDQTIRHVPRHGHDEAEIMGVAAGPSALQDHALDPLELVARLLLSVAEPGAASRACMPIATTVPMRLSSGGLRVRTAAGSFARTKTTARARRPQPDCSALSVGESDPAGD